MINLLVVISVFCTEHIVFDDFNVVYLSKKKIRTDRMLSTTPKATDVIMRLITESSNVMIGAMNVCTKCV